MRRDGIHADPVRGRLAFELGETPRRAIAQPYDDVQPRIRPRDLDGVAEPRPQRVEQGQAACAVAPPRATQMALEVSFGDEVCERALLERRRAAASVLMRTKASTSAC